MHSSIELFNITAAHNCTPFAYDSNSCMAELTLLLCLRVLHDKTYKYIDQDRENEVTDNLIQTLYALWLLQLYYA